MGTKRNKNQILGSVKLFDNDPSSSKFDINYCVFDDGRRVIVIDNNTTNNYCYYEPNIPEINQKEYMVISAKGPFEFDLSAGGGANNWPKKSQDEFFSGITLNLRDIQTSFDVFTHKILYPFLDSGINFFDLDEEGKEKVDTSYIGDLSNNGALATKYGTVLWQITGGEIHRISFANSNETDFVSGRLNIEHGSVFSHETFFSQIVDKEHVLSEYTIHEPRWVLHSDELVLWPESVDDDDADGVKDKMIDFEKFVPVEVCKTIESDLIEYTPISDIDSLIDIERVTVLDIVDIDNSVNGSIFRNHGISSTGKISKSLPLGKMKNIVLDVKYILSMKLSRHIDEINLSKHMFFISMNKINLAVGDDTVMRVGNSKRINFDRSHPASEQYRLLFLNSADVQIKDKMTIDNNFLYSLMLDTSKGRDFFSSVLAKSLERERIASNSGKDSYMQSFLSNQPSLGSNDEDDDPDGGSDIDKSSGSESDLPDSFLGEIKLITVGSQTDVNSLSNLDPSIINILDIFDTDELNEMIFITTDKQRLIYLRSCLYNKVNDINDCECIYILSKTWWEELGFKADLAICLDEDRESIEGHPKPILIIHILEHLNMKLLKDSNIYTGSVALSTEKKNNKPDDENKSTVNSSSISLGGLFNHTRTDEDIHEYNNDSNRYLHEFVSMDSAISGDTEKLIGGSFALRSGYHDGKDSDKLENNITICRLYKSVTVALFESNPNYTSFKSHERKELRANFLDLCDRIDDSKIAFINSFFFTGSKRVRSAAHPDDIVSSEYDKAIQQGVSPNDVDETSKNAVYSLINKFLPYITDFINSTSGIHPRFNFSNLSLLSGANYGHIGEGFHYFFFSSMRTVLFFNAHEKIDTLNLMSNFFIITNITEDFFLSRVLNDKNKLLDKKSGNQNSNGSLTSSLNFAHKRGKLRFDDLELSKYDETNKRIKLLRSSDMKPVFSRSSNSSVPTVNTKEASNLLLGHNTLIFCGIIEDELYMIADTRTTSGHFINTDDNTDKIQSITTESGDTFSFGCAGLVSDIQFCSRVFGDITAEMGKDWSFKEFVDIACDFLFGSYRNDQGLAVSIIIAFDGSIVELSSDGAQLDYSRSNFQAIGSGMMFVLPALNSLYSANNNNVDFKSVIDIFITAAKYDAGISTTYVLNKIGSRAKRIISFTDEKLSTVDV